MSLIGRLFGDDGGEGAVNDALARARQQYDNIQAPDLIWRDYAPEMMNSESMNYDLAQDNPLLKSMQMSQLNKMSDLSNTGQSDADAAGYARARSEGNQMARAGTDAAMQNAAARGVGGSGMEFAMREMANQAGAERANQSGLQQAADSARQRALYNTAFGNQLAQTRQQDYNTSKNNSDIINRFNAANTAQRNETSNANTGLRNQAQLTNNQGRTNTQQSNFNNQMQRAGAMAGQYQNQAGSAAAAGAARSADWNQMIGLGGQLGAGYLAGGGGGAAAAKAKPMAGNSYDDYSAYV